MTHRVRVSAGLLARPGTLVPGPKNEATPSRPLVGLESTTNALRFARISETAVFGEAVGPVSRWLVD